MAAITCAVRCFISTSSICMVIENGEVSSLSLSSGAPTSTAMTRSAPIALTTSTGTLLTMPPSTSSRPSTRIGANAAGTDMLPRIASARSPRPNTTASPVAMSVATARNGIDRSSNDSVLQVCRVRRRSRVSSFWPWITPRGSWIAPSRNPKRKSSR